MKRQDVSGVERLAVDSTGGGGASDVNLTGINGTAPSTGGGASDGGTLRVIVATDSPSSGNSAASATGAAVPADADYQGLNVAGTLRGATGVNPSGTIFAEQVDLASVAGTTAATGNGVVGAGVQRVAIASDNTAFAVNATLQAGSAIVGNVRIDQTTPGTTNGVGIEQIGATTVATGNGVVGAGVQRVAIASDNTAFAVNAAVTQSTSPWLVAGGGTAGTAASGVVSVQGIASMTPVQVSQATASNLNATVVQGTGTNLHTVVDSGSITVTQATGTNLHTVVDSGTVTTVSTVSDAQVQGKAASGASKSGNPVQTGAVFNTTQPTVTTGQVVENQATARGGLIVSTGADTFTVTANAGTNLNTSALALDASVTALKYALTVTALQVTASGDTTLVSSGTRKLHRVEMSNSHATTAVTAGIKIASVNGGAVFSKKYLPAAGGLAVLTFGGAGYIQATSEVISVNLSTTGQVECTAYYE